MKASKYKSKPHWVVKTENCNTTVGDPRWYDREQDPQELLKEYNLANPPSLQATEIVWQE